jgi:hypothetical protein
MLSNIDEEGTDKIDDEIAKQIASLNMKVRTSSVDDSSKNNSTNSTPAKLSLDSPLSNNFQFESGMTNNLLEEIVEECKECNHENKTPEKSQHDSNIIPETPPSVREVRRRVIGARAAATINEEVVETETRSTTNNSKDFVDITLLIIQYLVGAIIVYLLVRKVKISIEDI